MGIRYYAYPITIEQYPEALENPCRFHGCDPLMDAWGSDNEESPEMLYLDKCWGDLQMLLGPDSHEPRPAYRLVQGQVNFAGGGWIPHEAVLSPDEVQAVAEDLATVGDADIHRMVREHNRWNEPEEQSIDYVRQYLAAAQEFTARLAADGRGLVYLIG